MKKLSEYMIQQKLDKLSSAARLRGNDQLDATEIDIVLGLSGMANKNLGKHKELETSDWTKQVKQVFVDASKHFPMTEKDHGIGVCTSGFKAEGLEPEWLFDLCWYTCHAKEFGSEKRLRFRQLLLAMESEWNDSHNHIMYDFQKLMISRVPYRVMIFSQRDTEKVNDVFDLLINEVKTFEQSQAGDRYLLCGLNHTVTGLFEFRHYVHQP